MKHNAPSYGIGTEQRKGLAVKSGVPGPGTYKVRPGHKHKKRLQGDAAICAAAVGARLHQA